MVSITIKGTAGNDSKISDETFFGKPRFGTPLDEIFLLYGGDDMVSPGKGRDYIDGGPGNDTLYYFYFNEPTDINLTTGRVSGLLGLDTLVAIENVFGSKGSDTITGNNQNNILIGADSDDFIYSSLGNDTIDGHDNVKTSDSNSDTVSYEKLGKPIKADLSAGKVQKLGLQNIDQLKNIENLYGTDYNDTLIGDTKNNLLIGNKGKDYLVGGDGNDSLVGYGTANYGQQEIDTLIGGTGSDSFILNWFDFHKLPYDDGIKSDVVPPSPSLFGMRTLTSTNGWRQVNGGSSFHMGLDYNHTKGVSKPFTAGVSGKVNVVGGNFNTIQVIVDGVGTLEYLHASEIKVQDGQNVSPETVLGLTGGKGPQGLKQYAIHLHLQAKNLKGQSVHPADLITGSNTKTWQEWPQGLDDYLLIQDFNKLEDKIILPGNQSNYYLIRFEKSQTTPKFSTGTAIIRDDDGFVKYDNNHKADELIAFIPNQQLSDFTGFQFTG